MSRSIFSPSWYRVATLKPKLRSQAQVHRHYYRDKLWYVLQDHGAARYFRFTAPVHELIGLMDGERSLEEIWDIVSSRDGDDAPSQDDIIQLLGQLHACDVLQCDASPDALELFRRFQRKRRTDLKQRLMNPLSMRFPLLDPEEFLERWLPWIHPLFGWFGGLVWLCTVGAALSLAAVHWPELTDNAVNRAFTPYNLLLLWLAFPVVKALHELGHAFATKVWGGEVHEMGITLLVFTPIPYVDCSAASAFLDKRQRMLVGSAGILVEVFLAALALFVWLAVEPGIVREVAFNVMLIGGVSTLFFNGNPLLKFDGYYVLADAVEIPNLSTRAKKYFKYLFLRYVCGVREARSPATARGERRWFLGYGAAAFAYRLFIMFFIILFVAGKFFVVGLILAAWAVATQIVLPITKQLGFLLTSPQIRRHRLQALSVTGLLVALVAALVVYVPVPLRTQAEGVVWVPEKSQVRAGAEGTVVRLLSEPGERVEPGEPLIEMEDPFLEAEVKVLESRLEELTARYEAERISNRVQAGILLEDLTSVEADLAQTRSRADQLLVRSPAVGTFVVPDADGLPGRLASQGELLGYVVEASSVTARVVVNQADIVLLRQRTRAVAVKFADRLGVTLPAVIEREVPAANYLLPSKALGAAGGGRIAVDSQDPRGTKAMEKIFQLDVGVVWPTDLPLIGERVHVRFDHGSETLASQWYRSASQLLLRSFGV